MRFGSSITSVSWIPSESVRGLNQVLFAAGLVHYDEPPHETLDDLEAWRRADRFRFANHLAAWIEVSEGRVVEAGYAPDSGVRMGASTLKMAGRQATFAGVAFPELRREPEINKSSARFTQTAGGHAAMPAPRRVAHPPFVRLAAPTVWTTLQLTLHADGRAEGECVGASPFPRHWMYDGKGLLAAKAGLTDFKEWWLRAFGKHTPWGDTDSPALVTTVETALERQLATQIMRGGTKPRLRRLRKGALLTRQGEPGDELYLLLDGILRLEVDGKAIVEIGPGAILGERAVLEGGLRTATLQAVTPILVAVGRPDEIDPEALAELSAGHRREAKSPDETD